MNPLYQMHLRMNSTNKRLETSCTVCLMYVYFILRVKKVFNYREISFHFFCEIPIIYRFSAVKQTLIFFDNTLPTKF